MAAALFNRLADSDRARAISAGTQPAAQVHPGVVEVMRELGIELSQQQPQKLTEALAHTACLLITMGCEENCPVVPGLLRDDWPLRDPKGLGAEAVREVRDDIRTRVQALLHTRGWAKSSG